MITISVSPARILALLAVFVVCFYVFDAMRDTVADPSSLSFDTPPIALTAAGR